MKRLVFVYGWLVMMVAAAEPSLTLKRVYPRLTFDDNVTAATLLPGDEKRVVVGLQRGQIRILPSSRDGEETSMFLDLREKLKEETEFEEGLHGLAFHPGFPATRRVYVSYSQREPRRTVVSEFMVKEGETPVADPRSERVILEYPHPLGNHWGGGLAFGPDGYLYIGIGDGGLRDDPYRLSQNPWSLHGKILRIDVNGRSGSLAYGIPADNPFAERQEVRGEIWALGFRNPWGMAFDKPTGGLWCADVGQDNWEEVNLIQRGGNYGWSERDGPVRFATRGTAAEEGGPFIDPAHSYPHTEGISVTGGYVYRGKRLDSLQGRYLFGDWGVGKVWSLLPGEVPEVNLLFAKGSDFPAFNPTVIIADRRGEPLLFSHYPSEIYTLADSNKLAAADDEDAEDLPDDGDAVNAGEEAEQI